MIILQGKYNTATVFTKNLDEKAAAQIIELCSQEFCKDSKIRVMPDTHAGAGCTIGTTMTVQDKLVPNLVGVDIGCGMEVTVLKDNELDLDKLDKVIRNFVPSGFDTRGSEHGYVNQIDLNKLKCLKQVNVNRARLSIGTLGGGNHFIEVNKDNDGVLYLVVHSGSRYLGKQVADLYQAMAYKELYRNSKDREKLIKTLKKQGRQDEIEAELARFKALRISKDLAYLVGKNFYDYLHDMKLVQFYATLNRKAIVDEIVGKMKLAVAEQFTTIHNYIDMESMILRKGAISARLGEKVIIPINMRDGSLIAVGKGNAEWNYSAPHGAGRLMSRSAAKQAISVNEYRQAMEGIYTTCINKATVDEAPMAYKPMEEIIENTGDTIDIIQIIRPIYNYKAS